LGHRRCCHGTDSRGELNNQEHRGSWHSAYLIDGFFLAVNTKRVVESGARLDEQFEFVFYDRDFSRTVLKAGLRLGVEAIAVTHVSGVMVPGTSSYDKEVALYVQKWRTTPPPCLPNDRIDVQPLLSCAHS
jgi:hypothetical protein